MNTNPHHHFRIVAFLVLLYTYAHANLALAGYNAALLTPMPPGGAATFTWQTSGAKPGPGSEIGHVEVRGCWSADQVIAVSAVDRHGASVAVTVHQGGPKAHVIETGDVSDSRLPLEISVTFNATFGSAPTGTDLFAKTGGGRTAGFHFNVGGPTCAPPDEEEGESIEEGSLGHLALANLSERDFAPVSSPVRFELTGAALSSNPGDVRVFRNGMDLPASKIQVDGNAIILSGALNHGRNHLVVLATDREGKALSANATLWAGFYTLYVWVTDETGQPADGALVSALLGDDQSVAAESITSNGVAIFPNLPNWTVILKGTAEGNRFASTATYGAASWATLSLRAFDAPSPIANNDLSLGTAGWNIGSAPAQIVSHVEEGGGEPQALLNPKQAARKMGSLMRTAPPRDGTNAPTLPAGGGTVTQLSDASNQDLALNTAGEGPQSTSRAFTVAPGMNSVRVRFRFITSEVPGGWFGTQYNDFYSVSIRSQSGGGANVNSNSMNGLGLAAFDGNGATAWYEVSLPVNVAGDTVQVDVTVANVADGFYDSQVVVDYVAEEPLRITVDKETACPNETLTFQPEGNPTGTIDWSGGGNPATGTGTQFATRFAAAGQHTVQATLTSGSSTQSASKAVRINEASGAAWVARFPTSTSTADLINPFRGNLDRFIAAMRAGGATVNISATYRPLERAYLMHYAYRIAKQGLDPATVPAMADVDICWLHRDANGNPDLAASRAAAQAMVNGYKLVHPAALQSRHTERRAIDMSISWNNDLTLINGAGNTVTITSTPRTGAGNGDLHAVGATYGVHKLLGDAPHWSDDGH